MQRSDDSLPYSTIENVLIHDTVLFDNLTQYQVSELIQYCQTHLSEFNHCLNTLITYHNETRRIEFCINLLICMPYQSILNNEDNQHYTAIMNTIAEYWYYEGSRLRRCHDNIDNRLLCLLLFYMSGIDHQPILLKSCYIKIIKALQIQLNPQTNTFNFDLEQFSRDNPEGFIHLHDYLFNVEHEFSDFIKELSNDDHIYVNYHCAIFDIYASIAYSQIAMKLSTEGSRKYINLSDFYMQHSVQKLLYCYKHGIHSALKLIEIHRPTYFDKLEEGAIRNQNISLKLAKMALELGNGDRLKNAKNILALHRNQHHGDIDYYCYLLTLQCEHKLECSLLITAAENGSSLAHDEILRLLQSENIASNRKIHQALIYALKCDSVCAFKYLRDYYFDTQSSLLVAIYALSHQDDSGIERILQLCKNLQDNSSQIDNELTPLLISFYSLLEEDSLKCNQVNFAKKQLADNTVSTSRQAHKHFRFLGNVKNNLAIEVSHPQRTTTYRKQ